MKSLKLLAAAIKYRAVKLEAHDIVTGLRDVMPLIND